MFGVGDLKDAALCVIEQKDLAIAIGVVSVLCPFGRNVAVGNENNETPVGGHVAHRGSKKRARVRRDLNSESIRGCARRLGRDGGMCPPDEHKQ